MGRKAPSSARKVGIYCPKPTFLTYPEFSKDFIFNDDASKDHLDCAIYQNQQDQWRTLVWAEKRHYSSKLEYLAPIWVA